jgi:ATP-dependent DNA ligase
MAHTATQDPAGWRPQEFGKRSFRDIRDPLVEPLWRGLRVLAHVTEETVDLFDGEGKRASWPAIEAQLASALLVGSAILDGYVTDETAGSGKGVGAASPVETFTAGQLARQMIVGGGGRDRRRHLVESLEAQASREPDAGGDVVFVATDLLSLDDEPLIEIPLLERKRLLDSVLEESELVRRGVHVRPPVDTWVSTWQAIGFRGLAYKEANGRYRPGERNDGWATAPMPRR